MADQLRTASESITELAAAHAEQGERQQRVADCVIEAIVAAGFARHFVPRWWGGQAGSLVDSTAAIELIAAADASAAWLASVIANAGRFGVFLPERAQAELWADGPDRVLAGALVCSGAAEPVDDGWLLSGDWAYISGVELSGWALVCVPVTVDGQPQQRVFALPRSDYSVITSWNSTAMRATMSNTVRVRDAFVPGYRSFPRELMLSGSDDPSLPACHRAPMRAVSGLAFAAPIVGAAGGMLSTTARLHAGRTSPSHPGGDGSVQLGLTEAAGELQAARLLIGQVAAACDAGRFDQRERLEHVRDTSVAALLAGAAVNRLMPLCGTVGFAADRTAQRYWRDANCALSHPAVQLSLAADGYGPLLLASG